MAKPIYPATGKASIYTREEVMQSIVINEKTGIYYSTKFDILTPYTRDSVILKHEDWNSKCMQGERL